ncbi:efflux RND transporter periplasmic adaptor subunit [Paraburkholderia solisilvae]|uniref:Multidrug resistance protein MdtA n=1 Tax=Paraburkholderia solisilvae TaxID=624376 RepID=A0A6J5DK59_9BURK|nr:efflux RND transporter periplasmic adaptor subunit [Paraburkholderia solisilvae]CAB3753602.1 Multidrug resistance protein MdtA [Paraburkholderia solisilvae]
MSTEVDVSAPKRPAHLKLAGILIVLAAAAVLADGIASRLHTRHEVASWTMQQALPTVSTIQPQPLAATQQLVLPGHLAAWINAPIYARVSGYLHAWYADIGTPVKAGQLLGVIDTPDLDQQLDQARADLQKSVATEKLAVVTAQRWTQMLKQDSVSQQETDEKTSDLAAQQATVAAEQANVNRLEALESFKRIVAPFDGVVTARDTDVGALINAGGGNKPQLFTVSDAQRLRVYVSVPQSEAATVRPGMHATLRVPERPGMTFDATLVDTDHAITPSSGTLLVQLSVDNHAGLLFPGEYTDVRFALPTDAHALQIPASALIFRHNGLQVATLGPQGRAVMKPVTIATDLGSHVVIDSGLTAGDRVIDNPPDSLAAGDLVRVAPASPATPSPAAAAHTADAQTDAEHAHG